MRAVFRIEDDKKPGAAFDNEKIVKLELNYFATGVTLSANGKTILFINDAGVIDIGYSTVKTPYRGVGKIDIEKLPEDNL